MNGQMSGKDEVEVMKAQAGNDGSKTTDSAAGNRTNVIEREASVGSQSTAVGRQSAPKTAINKDHFRGVFFVTCTRAPELHSC